MEQHMKNAPRTKKAGSIVCPHCGEIVRVNKDGMIAKHERAAADICSASEMYVNTACNTRR